MKKLFILLFAAFSLAACSKELGPEYSVPAEIGTVTLVPVAPTADDGVMLSVPITSQYGLYSAWVSYWLNDDTETMDSTHPYYYTSSNTSVVFKPSLPKQKAGTKVTFCVLAATPTSVITCTKEYSYTVLPSTEEPAE